MTVADHFFFLLTYLLWKISALEISSSKCPRINRKLLISWEVKLQLLFNSKCSAISYKKVFFFLSVIFHNFNIGTDSKTENWCERVERLSAELWSMLCSRLSFVLFFARPHRHNCMTGMQGLVIPNLLSITTEFLSVNWLDVMDFTEGSNVGLAGCGMKLKPEAGCGIWKILKVRREMKIGRARMYSVLKAK